MGSPTLEERLAALGEADVSLRPPSADEMWSRGKRWQRRKALVSGLAGACVVALVDGERLACWAGGTPSGDPQTSGGQEETITGVVVHDLVSGKTLPHDFETDHGLMEQDLVWLDERTLVGSHHQWAVGDAGPVAKEGSGVDGSAWWWKEGESSPTAWPWGYRSVPDALFSATRDGRALVDDAGPCGWLTQPRVSACGPRSRLRGWQQSGVPGRFSGPPTGVLSGWAVGARTGRPTRSRWVG